MYLDLVAGNAHGSYNRKLAKLIGLQSAVYISEIINIMIPVVKKSAMDRSGFFKVNRKYVSEMTTLTEEEQYTCDASLAKLGIIKISDGDKDRLTVNLAVYSSTLAEDDVKKLTELSKKAKINKVDKAAAKKLGIIAALKNHVNEQDPELRRLYEDWIQAVYDRGSFMNAAIVDYFQVEINNYTDDINAKKRIVQYAVTSGYKQADWVINQFEKSYGFGARKQTSSQEAITTTVAEGITF